MGEVKYWLGKQQEGKQLFDELLLSQKRAFDALYEVARCYRVLGAESETRALLEEAYNQKDVPLQKRQQAAYVRALTSKDLDDQITWLERADVSNPGLRATLTEARGERALRDGK